MADDGSTDESTAIAARFGSPVRLLRLTAQGGNVARNAAQEAANGEWLQFLDADDFIEAHKVEKQMAEAGDLSRWDVLYSPVWEETWRDGRVRDRRLAPLDTSHDLATQWITWQLPQTGGPLWRASALRRIGGWNPAMPCCQEHELYLRALQAGLKWQFCPSAGAVYRIWSEGTVCRKDPLLVIRTRTALIDSMLAWLKNSGRLTDGHRDAAAQAFFEMARTWARHDLEGAANYLAERRASKGIALRGPAAPLSYRIAYHALGFRGAETLARRLR